MPTIRLRFEKTGAARYISHLDLMRAWQRAFRRAGLPLTFSAGFNPHPHLSIARPLPVGVGSVCELLDFGIESAMDGEALPGQINSVLPPGLRVLEAWPASRKFRDIAWAVYRIGLSWDGPPIGVDIAAAAETLGGLLDGRELPAEKKGKKGATRVDAAPLVRHGKTKVQSPRSLELGATLAAGDISLGPALLLEALLSAAGEAFVPWTGVRVDREALLDGRGMIFDCKPIGGVL